LHSTDFSDIPDPARFATLETLDSAEISRKVREFMIAATAKDCSVMISLLPLDSEQRENGHFKTMNGKTFFKIFIFFFSNFCR
jgi:hypothetical protein